MLADIVQKAQYKKVQKCGFCANPEDYKLGSHLENSSVTENHTTNNSNVDNTKKTFVYAPITFEEDPIRYGINGIGVDVDILAKELERRLEEWEASQ